MIEGPEEWAIFTDPDVFGEVITYQGQGQTPAEITAVFSAPYALIDGGPGPGVATTQPTLTFGSEQLTFTPRQGDQVTLTQSHPGFPAGTTLRVADPQPDGAGLIRLILERN
ncbi:hypothetical protein GFB49_11630 [Epibacterium sp. SM1979]|uniref:Uncharacterized protein n=1 Tax=Tritonibacter litoralis TaxID=2662264 RepID=A0A843YK84_9RHOB|nr:hypothetical protein [Tritonibacter litoralis]MQQ09107.1 hypothetical protein [Tritonibacter litoralis]